MYYHYLELMSSNPCWVKLWVCSTPVQITLEPNILLMTWVRTEPQLNSRVMPAQHKKASNHHANLPLEMYSFTL